MRGGRGQSPDAEGRAVERRRALLIVHVIVVAVRHPPDPRQPLQSEERSETRPEVEGHGDIVAQRFFLYDTIRRREK